LPRRRRFNAVADDDPDRESRRKSGQVSKANGKGNSEDVGNISNDVVDLQALDEVDAFY